MTGNHEEPPQNRVEDRTRRGQIIAWWRRWGQLIVGAWLMLISVVVLVVALDDRSFQLERRQQQQETAKAARTACERSRKFGPQIADFYLRNGFDAKLIAQYRASIPKTCPSDPGKAK